AGMVTSVGPCAAPRYVAVAACAHAARRPRTIVAAFACGLVCAYVALGLVAGALGTLWAASAAVYGLMAAALAVSGIVTLARARGGSHSHSHGGVHDDGDLHEGVNGDGHAHGGVQGARRHNAAAPGNVSAGGVFLLGASSALVVSPCCTPVVAGIAGLTLASGHSAAGISLLAVFACGHVLPVLAAGALGTRLSAALRHAAALQAPSIVAGSLMLALAAYYGTLA
ncbi:MAG: Cytochrome biosis protein transrane region, partial [Candidatus Eremiobacteraeota bacterium]|nr:Cytochrome biosis protein transrane region [Candidatus Eremiobacteraeota bacterium]